MHSTTRGHRPASLLVALLLGTAAPSALATDSTGLIPLTDMTPGQTFDGLPGGLYPNGLNYLQGAALSDRVRAGMSIAHRNAAGVPTPQPAGGRIVLLSIGMSNTSQESTAFAPLFNNFPDRNPGLVFVNGAQGGQTAADISNPNANFWNVIDQRLQNAGVSANQVQAVWLKEANRQPTGPATNEIATLRGQLETIAQIIRSRYPNTQVIYASSRIYAGYATTALNPEPYAYASGFSVKQLVADQVSGADPGLTWGPGGVAPLVQWGPYLWADGLAGRNDGLIWEASDYQADGTHPSDTGQAKVAAMLLEFFSTDPSARMWFLRPAARQRIGDLNGDGAVSVGDIAAFVLALTDPTTFATQFPQVNLLQAADLNFDGTLTVTDISGFVALLTE